MYVAITFRGHYQVREQCLNCGLITECIVDPITYQVIAGVTGYLASVEPAERERLIDDALDRIPTDSAPPLLYVVTEKTAVRRMWEVSQ